VAWSNEQHSHRSVEEHNKNWILTATALAETLTANFPKMNLTLHLAISSAASHTHTHEGVSRSFRTGHLEREQEMVQLSTTSCSYIVILWVSIVNFAAITLCVASQWVFIVVSVYFVIDSVRKLLDTHSYSVCVCVCTRTHTHIHRENIVCHIDAHIKPLFI
jgi:hypothetical protein